MKQNYELSYLISPRLSDEGASDILRQVNNAIQEKEGVVFDSQLPRKFSLAYTIQKENEAWLQITYFSLEPAQLAEVEKKLRETKEIFRSLILKRKPVKMTPLMQPLTEKIKSIEALEPSQKVDLEEIEKKLEEILGQNELK
ncbi:MAG: 30S ribosomal protein S6 [bacterium]|nr:30S ribosomal protein S6 [bacterium]